MAPCRVADIQGLPYRAAVLASWLLALWLAASVWAASRAARRPSSAWTAAGLGIMSVPAWAVLIATAPDMVRTFCAQGNVAAILPPAAPPQVTYGLSSQVIGALQQLAYVAVGALVWLQGRDPGWWRAPTVARIAAGIGRLLPMGRGERTSLRLGVAAFPLLAAANLVLAAITGLQTRYYADVTAYHAILLALAAGVGEELLYRGVMQQGVRHLLQRAGMRRGGAVAVALVAQAIPFAYAHAGYGAPALLLFAFLFAAIAGVVAQRWGIWTAIALHALIDFYSFAMDGRDVVLTGLAVVVAVPVLWVTWSEGRRAWQARSGGA